MLNFRRESHVIDIISRPVLIIRGLEYIIISWLLFYTGDCRTDWETLEITVENVAPFKRDRLVHCARRQRPKRMGAPCPADTTGTLPLRSYVVFLLEQLVEMQNNMNRARMYIP